MVRTKELVFLTVCFLASTAGFYAIGLHNFLQTALLINLPLILLSVFNHSFLSESSQIVLPLASLLLNLGCVNLSQINTSYLNAQIRNIYLAVVFSIVGTYIFSRLKKPFSYRFFYGTVALALFFIPIFFGKEIYGAKLWINLGSFSFQPSEIARVFFVLFLSGYLAERQRVLKKESGLSLRKQLIYLIPALIMTVFSLLLLIYVKDLGFSLLILSTFLVALFASTENLLYVAVSVLLFLAGSYSSYHLFFHVKRRIDAWLNPWKDPFGQSYQILQSLFAYAEGGITGLGLKRGFPNLIPAAHTDMVIPVFAESCGFTGTLTVFTAILFLCMALFAESLKVKKQAEKIFLVTAGFSIFFQMFLVAAGTLNLLPLTGLTVPFFSYGGSSLVASLFLVELSLLFSSRYERWIVK